MALVAIKNETGETIPAWGVVQVASAERLTNGRMRLIASKPDGASSGRYVANGGVAIADGGHGHVHGTFVWVAYDPDNAPSAGSEWGPVDDSWVIEESGRGFLVLYVDTDRKKAYCLVLHGDDADVGGGYPSGSRSSCRQPCPTPLVFATIDDFPNVDKAHDVYQVFFGDVPGWDDTVLSFDELQEFTWVSAGLWETDQFELECPNGVDTGFYHFELTGVEVAHASGATIIAARILLVHDSGTDCGYCGEWIAHPFWSVRQLTEFYRNRSCCTGICAQKICVKPVLPDPPESECLDALRSTWLPGQDLYEWPTLLRAEIVSVTSADGYDLSSLEGLTFDLPWTATGSNLCGEVAPGRWAGSSEIEITGLHADCATAHTFGMLLEVVCSQDCGTGCAGVRTLAVKITQDNDTGASFDSILCSDDGAVNVFDTSLTPSPVDFTRTLGLFVEGCEASEVVAGSIVLRVRGTSTEGDDIDPCGKPLPPSSGGDPDPPEVPCGDVYSWNGSAYELESHSSECCDCDQGEECVATEAVEVPDTYEGDTIFIPVAHTCDGDPDCDNVYVNCCNSNTGLCYAGSYTDCQCDGVVNAALSPVGDCTTTDTCCVAGEDVGPLTECACALAGGEWGGVCCDDVDEWPCCHGGGCTPGLTECECDALGGTLAVGAADCEIGCP